MNPSPPLSADRAQDAAIAEALGLDSDIESFWVECYSSDPVAFEALMQEIGRRGLGPNWCNELKRLVCEQRGEFWWIDRWMCSDDAWKLFAAPQSIRAAAALAVLRESQEATNG